MVRSRITEQMPGCRGSFVKQWFVSAACVTSLKNYIKTSCDVDVCGAAC